MILDKDVVTIYTKVTAVNGTTTFNPTRVFSGPCKLQPASDIISGSFDGNSAMHAYNIYVEFPSLRIGDKMVINGTAYYVKGLERQNGILRSHVKALVNTEYN